MAGSAMSDDLVERVALAIDSAICDGDQSSIAMELTSEEIKVLARAAIAVLRPALRADALEEAAKVCDACPDSHWGPSMAAAIRALKESK